MAKRKRAKVVPRKKRKAMRRIKHETPPWTICPECGCGPGEDHKKNCSKGKRPEIARYG